MNPEQTLIHYKSKANEIISVGQQRGYDLPTEYTTAAALGAEAARVAQEPAPVIGTPKDAKDVAATITKAAKARLEHREAQAVAAELEANCARVAINAALAVAPSYAAKVCGEYAELLTTFTKLLGTAPQAISGHTSPEEFLQHAELLRARDALAIAYAHRGILAPHIEADEGIAGTNAIWLILDPTPDTSLSEIRSALTDYAHTMPTTVEDWTRIARLGTSMAKPGEAAARIAGLAQATLAASKTHDGGMAERTYGQALALRAA
jgi:hypothetical protein